MGIYSSLSTQRTEKEKAKKLESQPVFSNEPEEKNAKKPSQYAPQTRAENRTEQGRDYPSSEASGNLPIHLNLPRKRHTKRSSFEFFEDQLTLIRQLKLQAEMRGEILFQSAIVREALDEYFQRRGIRSDKNRQSLGK